ncbi:hypothetical protein RSOLAG1IB_09832 [Rhizoctonia solani AG-1 IB]|uniref:Transmembrane protein n=1 Tax=Thanatephorus cucumeris (strain AG1-IB / isolate 7/3/14) TaxID=1108050 RepID=A0A0B7FWF0_THACB|nr:hypothetical protein RSOLAG1IB_09832 [Rhizoctonia solani AG-1 IB]
MVSAPVTLVSAPVILSSVPAPSPVARYTSLVVPVYRGGGKVVNAQRPEFGPIYKFMDSLIEQLENLVGRPRPTKTVDHPTPDSTKIPVIPTAAPPSPASRAAKTTTTRITPASSRMDYWALQNEYRFGLCWVSIALFVTAITFARFITRTLTCSVTPDGPGVPLDKDDTPRSSLACVDPIAPSVSSDPAPQNIPLPPVTEDESIALSSFRSEPGLESPLTSSRNLADGSSPVTQIHTPKTKRWLEGLIRHIQAMERQGNFYGRVYDDWEGGPDPQAPVEGSQGEPAGAVEPAKSEEHDRSPTPRVGGVESTAPDGPEPPNSKSADGLSGLSGVDSIDAWMQAIPHGQEDTVSDQQLSAMHELANVSRLVSTDTQTSDRMFRQSDSLSSVYESVYGVLTLDNEDSIERRMADILDEQEGEISDQQVAAIVYESTPVPGLALVNRQPREETPALLDSSSDTSVNGHLTLDTWDSIEGPMAAVLDDQDGITYRTEVGTIYEATEVSRLIPRTNLRPIDGTAGLSSSSSGASVYGLLVLDTWDSVQAQMAAIMDEGRDMENSQQIGQTHI